MDKQLCFQLGYFEKTHGLRGELVLVLDTDNPKHYTKTARIFVETKGVLVAYKVLQWNLVKDSRVIVALESVNHIDLAVVFRGSAVWLPLDELPSLGSGQYYYHDIIGFDVIDERLGALGKVSNVYLLPKQEMLAMQYEGVEVLIPLHDDIVKRVELQAQTVYTKLPEGLLEIYLPDPNAPKDSEELEQE